MVKKKELRQIDNNDNVLILYGMDNVEFHTIVEFVEKMNEERFNRKETEFTAEECSLVGEQHIVPCGTLYKGYTIKDVYASFGICGLWDLLKATPRKDGSEDEELHGGKLTEVIALCQEAWTYFFAIAEGMNPADWAYILNDLQCYGEMDGIKAAQRMFALVNVDQSNMLDVLKLELKMPDYNGKTIDRVYEEGGERAVAKMMKVATNTLDIDSFDIGRKFLKELHSFKGFVNPEEIAALYQIKAKDPDEIVAECANRMDARYEQLVQEKNKENE